MADTLFKMKVGDTRPYLRATITDQDGNAVDLTGATTVFNMTSDNTSRSAKVSNGACAVVNTTGGIVEYRWTSTDTNTAGNYLAEFQVTLADNTVFTVPNEDSLKVELREDYN